MLHEGDDPKPKPKKKLSQGTLTNKEVTSKLVNMYDDSNLKSGSSIIGYEGSVLNKAEVIIKAGAKGTSFSDKKYILKTLNMTSKVGTSLGIAGIGFTTYEDFNSARGITWGTVAKVGIGGALLFASAPVSLTYAALDIGVGLTTGTTITDRVGNYVNQKTR